MSDKNVDRAKGRVQAATGALSAIRSPKNTGHVDQANGAAANTVNNVTDIQRSK
jgi:uncharacterized protein YjbJ (UPF0337 family)